MVLWKADKIVHYSNQSLNNRYYWSSENTGQLWLLFRCNLNTGQWSCIRKPDKLKFVIKIFQLFRSPLFRTCSVIVWSKSVWLRNGLVFWYHLNTAWPFVWYSDESRSLAFSFQICTGQVQNSKGQKQTSCWIFGIQAMIWILNNKSRMPFKKADILNAILGIFGPVFLYNSQNSSTTWP